MRWCLLLLTVMLLCAETAVSAAETYVFDGRWAGLNAPYEVAVDGRGGVYVASMEGVERFDGWGTPITQYMSYPEMYGVAVHGDTVYASDPGSEYPGGADGRVYLFSSRGMLLGKWNGTPYAFHHPKGLGTDSLGRLWVADSHNNQVRAFWPNGTASVVCGSDDWADNIDNPKDVAVNATGYVYVTSIHWDAGTGEDIWVAVFGPGCSVVDRWGLNGSAPGEIFWPHGIAIDAAGSVFVADTGNHRVQKFSPDGTLLATIGVGRIRTPVGVAVDAAGTVFVTADGTDPLPYAGVQRFRQPLAVPSGAGSPASTGEDGLCDDVNGNGRKDFADVVLYFNQMTWIAANEPVAGFDYNGNVRVDFADVVWLFNNL